MEFAASLRRMQMFPDQTQQPSSCLMAQPCPVKICGDVSFYRSSWPLLSTGESRRVMVIRLVFASSRVGGGSRSPKQSVPRAWPHASSQWEKCSIHLWECRDSEYFVFCLFWCLKYEDRPMTYGESCHCIKHWPGIMPNNYGGFYLILWIKLGCYIIMKSSCLLKFFRRIQVWKWLTACRLVQHLSLHFSDVQAPVSYQSS